MDRSKPKIYLFNLNGSGFPNKKNIRSNKSSGSLILLDSLQKKCYSRTSEINR